MGTHLTSFATREFEPSLHELARSARRFGVDEIELWNPEAVRHAGLLKLNGSILESGRGAGFWIWKPYLIERMLHKVAKGDIVVYADAGVSVIRTLVPLFDLCHAKGGILLFAGHYDSVVPSICRIWTKRDCFVFMDCDSLPFHEAPMLDASFLVFEKNDQSVAFVRRWRELVSRPEILTDAPNISGKENLPGFIEHRHDQSILSLMAASDKLEIFRGPSQFGNHCKVESAREAGEWIRRPYEKNGGYVNSPYGTLLFHHRKRTISPGGNRHDIVTGSPALDLAISFAGTTQSPLRVLEAGPREPEHSPACFNPTAGVDYRRWSRLDEGEFASLGDHRFHIILSHVSSASPSMELEFIVNFNLLDCMTFVLCWTGLEGVNGWAEFREVAQLAERVFGKANLFARFGWASKDGSEATQTVGIIGRAFPPAC